MVYPFPRFANTPQTPQYIQGIESPSTNTPRSPKSRSSLSPKRFIALVFFVVAALLWLIDPFSRSSKETDKIPFSHDDIDDYLVHFEGHQDCGITSPSLYTPPAKLQHHKMAIPLPYCRNRATLLEALSGGGRHGFDAPFFPAGCHYRWYTTAEICMILDRFDAVVFIGDSMLQNVYSAFNMLLRENVALGGLKQWNLKDNERSSCYCDNQFMRPECSGQSITSSAEVRENEGGSGHRSPYYCDRTPHYFLSIGGSPAPSFLHSTFSNLLSASPDSYKPVPVVHSLSLSTSLSWPLATASMDEWLSLADASTRNVPFLWVGPTAAGHLKPPGLILSQGNNALWHYTVEMSKEAQAREVDALGMYNLTLQASSWDGSGYGMRVGLMQAMMVINWLSRLEST
ncbi:hypothetical protein MMC11_006633 [Xylographa trunciseda]|nr:hypothetical protein [Xylographa trunciseda]